MVISCVPVGYLKTNCYILHKEGMNTCIVVDPGDDAELIFNELEKEKLTPEFIVLTHAHFDHIHEIPALKEKWPDIKLYCLDKEARVLADRNLNASLRFHRPQEFEPDAVFGDGDIVELAGLSFKVISTPGHTIGSACFLFESNRILLSGDTLFYENVGRSDFATGNGEMLMNSISEKLFALPDDIKVLPGHGEPTTIKHEKEYNPFFA